MNFYTQQHKPSCGSDLHAKAMDGCILDQSGPKRVHQNLPTPPAAFLRVITPDRDDLVVAVECLFTWEWLADQANRGGVEDHLPDPSGRQTIEGDGSRINPYDQLLSEVARYLVSSCRVVQCVKESNGKRLGTSGQKIGTVHWRWACAAAAVLF